MIASDGKFFLGAEELEERNDHCQTEQINRKIAFRDFVVLRNLVGEF